MLLGAPTARQALVLVACRAPLRLVALFGRRWRLGLVALAACAPPAHGHEHGNWTKRDTAGLRTTMNFFSYGDAERSSMVLGALNDSLADCAERCRAPACRGERTACRRYAFLRDPSLRGSVLSYGCAQGAEAAVLSSVYPRADVVCTDLSERALADARVALAPRAARVRVLPMGEATARRYRVVLCAFVLFKALTPEAYAQYVGELLGLTAARGLGADAEERPAAVAVVAYRTRQWPQSHFRDEVVAHLAQHQHARFRTLYLNVSNFFVALHAPRSVVDE